MCNMYRFKYGNMKGEVIDIDELSPGGQKRIASIDALLKEYEWYNKFERNSAVLIVVQKGFNLYPNGKSNEPDFQVAIDKIFRYVNDSGIPGTTLYSRMGRLVEDIKKLGYFS